MHIPWKRLFRLKLFWRRLAESFLAELVMAASCTALFYFNIVDQTEGFFLIFSLLCIFTNLIYTAFRIKAHIDDTVCSISCFFTNLLVVIIIGTLALALAFFDAEPLFTWLFFPYKMLHINFGHTKVMSSLYLSSFYLSFSFLVTYITWKILKY